MAQEKAQDRLPESCGKAQFDKTSQPGVVLSLENGLLLKRIKNNTSRMTGDCHVRFCERLGGETPLAYSAVNYSKNGSGRGSVWLERDVRDVEVAGSNPVAPTTLYLYFQLYKNSHKVTKTPGFFFVVLCLGALICGRRPNRMLRNFNLPTKRRESNEIFSVLFRVFRG